VAVYCTELLFGNVAVNVPSKRYPCNNTALSNSYRLFLECERSFIGMILWLTFAGSSM
jgi:hypothetical protein